MIEEQVLTSATMRCNLFSSTPSLTRLALTAAKKVDTWATSSFLYCLQASWPSAALLALLDACLT